MKIPRDLKPDDRLWYSETEYATVTTDAGRWATGYIDTRRSDGQLLIYRLRDGVEEGGDSPPIIRIERIASAPAKVKRAKVSAADRLIAIAQRCIPHVNPKMFAGELAKTKPMADCHLNTLLRRAVNAAKRERAITRRLEENIQ